MVSKIIIMMMVDIKNSNNGEDDVDGDDIFVDVRMKFMRNLYETGDDDVSGCSHLL